MIIATTSRILSSLNTASYEIIKIMDMKSILEIYQLQCIFKGENEIKQKVDILRRKTSCALVKCRLLFELKILGSSKHF